VAFDAQQVQDFLDEGPLGSARLVLTPGPHEAGSLRHAPRLVAYPLSDAFEEGDGNSAAGDRGAGPGATWHCAVDAEVGDNVEECLLDWTKLRRAGGARGARPAPGSPERLAVFDVADHVSNGISAWIVESLDRRPLRESFGYVSREGADALDDLALAPTLVLTHEVAQDQGLAADATE
jgi:hypothetical protein